MNMDKMRFVFFRDIVGEDKIKEYARIISETIDWHIKNTMGIIPDEKNWPTDDPHMKEALQFVYAALNSDYAELVFYHIPGVDFLSECLDKKTYDFLKECFGDNYIYCIDSQLPPTYYSYETILRILEEADMVCEEPSADTDTPPKYRCFYAGLSFTRYDGYGFCITDASAKTIRRFLRAHLETAAKMKKWNKLPECLDKRLSLKKIVKKLSPIDWDPVEYGIADFIINVMRWETGLHFELSFNDETGRIYVTYMKDRIQFEDPYLVGMVIGALHKYATELGVEFVPELANYI